MWTPNPLSLWVWAAGGAEPAPPTPDGGAAFIDECGVARNPVARGVVFAVTHNPTCPPRRYFFFRALTWLFGMGPAYAR